MTAAHMTIDLEIADLKETEEEETTHFANGRFEITKTTRITGRISVVSGSKSKRGSSLGVAIGKRRV